MKTGSSNTGYPDYQTISFWLGLSLVATWISQSLMDFSFVVAVGICIYHTVKSKISYSPNPRLKVIVPVMLSYLAVAALGFAVNGRPEAEVLFDLSRFFWIVQFVLLTYLVRHIRFSHSKAWWTNFSLLLIPAIYGLNIFVTDGGIDSLTQQYTHYRVVGLVNSATYHAHIAGFFIIIGTAFALAQFKKFKELSFKKAALPLAFILGSLVFFSLSLFFTKTRGAILALLLSFFVFTFLYLKKRSQKLILILLLVLATFFSLNILTSKQRAVSDDCRVVLLKVHYEIFKKFPVLGMGYRDNMRKIDDYWPQDLREPKCVNFWLEGSHAHNQYLNAAATTGALGLLCYLIIILYFLKENWLWWRAQQSLLSLTCLTLQIYFLISCMTDTTFEFAKIRFLLLAVWALVINRELFQESEKA